jgi:hypothetical protein
MQSSGHRENYKEGEDGISIMAEENRNIKKISAVNYLNAETESGNLYLE